MTAHPLAIILTFERHRPDWHALAACVRSDVDFTSTHPAERSAAFTLCGTCDFRDCCLEWALEVEDFVAILGGTDGPARRRIAAQRTTSTKENTDATT